MLRPLPRIVQAGVLDYWHVSRPLHPGLRPFVKTFEGYFGAMPSAFHVRTAPIVHPALVINLGEPFRLVGRDGAADAGSGAIGSWVRGMEDRPRQIVHGAVSELILVRCTPVAMYRLLGMPMSELRNSVVAFRDVWGPAAHVVEDRLASAPDWQARFDFLERELLARIGRGPECAPEVVHGWRLLTGSGGAIPVSRIAAEIGWSHQHLIRRFTQQVGAAPKTAARILRFRRAVGMIATGNRGLAEIAALCGYADQAHMAREFRDLSGTSPGQAISDTPEQERFQVRPQGWQDRQPGEDPFY